MHIYDQTHLIDKFNVYFKVDNTGTKYIKDGLCHGFSIVHAAMNAIGKIEWWKNTINEIALWDCKKRSLRSRVKFKGSENPTLRKLFERVISYVLFYQGKFFSQDKMMKKHFEIQVNENNGLSIKKVESQKIVAGCFVEDDLLDILDESLFKTNICLIHSTDHTCSLCFDKCHWYFYDPNDEQGERSFKKKSNLIAFLFYKLGNSLAVEINSFKKKALDHLNFNEIYEKKACDLIEGLGLHLIVAHRPDKLQSLLKQACFDDDFASTFACFLEEKDDDGWTALQMILNYCPQYIPDLFYLVKTNEDIADSFAFALAKTNNKKKSCLYSFVHFGKDYLTELFELAQINSDIEDSLINCLVMEDSKNRTGFQMLLEYASDEDIEPVFVLACKRNVLAESIGLFLKKLIKEKISGLSILIKKIPSLFCYVVFLANKLTSFRKNFGIAFIMQNMQEKNGLHLMIDYVPDYIIDLFDLVDKHQDFCEFLAVALKQKNRRQKRTGFHSVSLKSKVNFPRLLQLAKKRKSLRESLIFCLKEQDKNGLTPVHKMICRNPAHFSEILTLAWDDEKVGFALSKSLKIEDQKGVTPLQFVESRAKRRNVFALLKVDIEFFLYEQEKRKTREKCFVKSKHDGSKRRKLCWFF